MRRLLCGFILIAACGKSGGGGGDADWTKQPVKQLDGIADGIKYTLVLPADWTPRKPPDEGWESPSGDQFERPATHVGTISLDGTLEDAIATAGGTPDKFVRKDKRSDGFSLTEVHDQGLIRATTFRKAGAKYLWCTATQANNDGIPNFATAKPALEKICDSIVAK